MSAKDHFHNYLEQKLQERYEKGLMRTLVHRRDKIDFSSNDYFGLSSSPAYLFLNKNNRSGATGSRSISGNMDEAEEAEYIIAEYHNQEAALIFNSGYAANVGLFSCIASKGETYISDEYIHASIIDGMRLSHANRLKFKHNDLLDLEHKLRQTIGRKFVAVESIYSMDGDAAPLIEIAALCNQYDALLIVDEAHATGVFGARGEGLVCQYGLESEVLTCVYTYGKAAGIHGAAVVGSNILRNHLINNARSFVFSTALPPHTYEQIKTAYSLFPFLDREFLFDLIQHFRNAAANLHSLVFLDSVSPIQGIIIGDNFKAKALAQYLSDKGYFIRAILSPTVPVGRERLRICLHTFNSKSQIDDLLNEINSFLS